MQQKKLSRVVWRADFWCCRVLVYVAMCWRILGWNTSKAVHLDIVAVMLAAFARVLMTQYVAAECWECCCNVYKSSEGCKLGFHNDEISLHRLSYPRKFQ